MKWLLKGDPCNEVKEKINSTVPYIKLYASSNIAKEYIRLQNEIQTTPDENTYNKTEKLIKDIRKDLKISE